MINNLICYTRQRLTVRATDARVRCILRVDHFVIRSQRCTTPERGDVLSALGLAAASHVEMSERESFISFCLSASKASCSAAFRICWRRTEEGCAVVPRAGVFGFRNAIVTTFISVTKYNQPNCHQPTAGGVLPRSAQGSLRFYVYDNQAQCCRRGIMASTVLLTIVAYFSCLIRTTFSKVLIKCFHLGNYCHFYFKTKIFGCFSYL